MFETKETQPRILLAAVDTGEYDVEQSMAELSELTRTAGADPVAQIVQKRPALETATCIGPGRLEEMAELCKAEEIDQIIFDHELTATQIRNIENVCGVHTIDRTMLILDIFAGRATTKEGRLQVELAQQKYRLPRLAGMGVQLSRLGGGIGTRGPGETKLETDKRHIRSRIQILSEELREIEKRRTYSRARRKKDGVLVCAIVGYTNVGKSTLLNALTDAGVLAENKLFATLETTARAIELPDGRSVMLVDTVGLIRRLPHHLVEAFKSTLEEAANADVILHIVDASAPDCEEQAQVTLALLNELGCEGIPVVTAFNKCDLTPELSPADFTREGAVAISAKAGTGIDALLAAITAALPPTTKRLRLCLPYDKAGLLSAIRENGKVFSEAYTESGIEADVLADLRTAAAVAMYQV